MDFYFDFASPYGYFASEKIEALAARYGRVIRWRPILLFAVLRAHGLAGPMEHPLKRAYMLADFERSAKFLGVQYRAPASFPIVTQHAARAFYLIEQAAPDLAVPFAHAVLRAYWRESRDIASPAAVAAIVSDMTPALGAAEDVLAQLQGDVAKGLLTEAINRAVAAGVFGSPFFMLDGEPFFGADRLPQLEVRMAGSPR
ncbi:MAG: 2-hydroxychromene-2-carboxylate isomerase [Pseudomonadota bacterium]